MTKLRWFIIKKLHSFSKAKKRTDSSKAERWGHESVTATIIPEEPTAPVLVQGKAPSRTTSETDQPRDVQSTVHESVPSMEVGTSVAVSESVDTLEDLVDQMEIEISDHGDDGDSEETMGEESLDELPSDSNQQTEKTETSEKASEKIQSSATVSSSGDVVGKGEIQPKPEVQFSRRRRHSSTRIDKLEFPHISLGNQLSDDEIIELMELLQVYIVGIFGHLGSPDSNMCCNAIATVSQRHCIVTWIQGTHVQGCICSLIVLIT